MQPSDRCVRFIAQHEGFSAVAYQDGGGVWTLGFGRAHGVKAHDVTTKEAALIWLREDMETAANAVERLAPVPLNQNQYDALVSLCYNIGAGNMAKAHSILDPLAAGDYDKAAEGFLLWKNIAGKPSQGLLNRRQDEKAMFLEVPA